MVAAEHAGLAPGVGRFLTWISSAFGRMRSALFVVAEEAADPLKKPMHLALVVEKWIWTVWRCVCGLVESEDVLRWYPVNVVGSQLAKGVDGFLLGVSACHVWRSQRRV